MMAYHRLKHFIRFENFMKLQQILIQNMIQEM